MEESQGCGGGGLGFVTVLYMGEDRIGEVRVLPQPAPGAPQSQSQSQSESPSQAGLIVRQQQQQQQEQSQPQSPSQLRQQCDDASRGREEMARMAFGSQIRVASLSPPSERCLPLMVLHTISMDGVWFKLQPEEDSDLDMVNDPSQDNDNTITTTTTNNNNNNITNNMDIKNNNKTPQSTVNPKLQRLYKTCIEEAKTAVVPMDDGSTELHLVAIKSDQQQQQQQQQQVCCFWAFAVPQGLYASCLSMLNMRCLAMVFDLDETLILANTMRSFEDRIDALKMQAEKQRIPVPNKGMDTQKLASLTAEMKRYQHDRALLKQYIENDYVIENGRVIPAQFEEVLIEGAAPIMRPVIRIPERNMILTRINPAVRDTSVLVRLRPAWDELRAYLVAKGRKRFEVFICTMSERDYALEMWRLLDPGARLIETRELQRRLLCVKAGSKKSLSNMFQQLRMHCHPRMAMVIDDRPDVWEDKDQPHVHSVPAFAPYFAPQAETNTPVPILCVARNVACNVRGGFFKDFDEVLSEKFAQITFDTDVSTLPSTPYVGTYLTEAGLDENLFPENLPCLVKVFPDGITGSEVQSALYPEEMSLADVNASQLSQRQGSWEQRADDLNLEQQTATPAPTAGAGGWLEDEDEEQIQPESPTKMDPAPASGFASTTATENATENHNNGSVDRCNGDKEPAPEDSQIGKESKEGVAVKKIELSASDPLLALQELGEKSKTTVEYRCAIRATEALQFSAEVYFDGKKVGDGCGKTNKEAKTRAAEDALRCLASSWSSARAGELENGNQKKGADERNGKDTQERKRPSFNATAALREMCAIEGLKVEYLERPPAKGTLVCEVEVAGQILGKGTGTDLESAKHQAAEQALRQLSLGAASKSRNQKRSSPPRTTTLLQQETSNKRIKSGDAWRPPTSANRGSRDRTKYSRSRSFPCRR